MLKNKSTGFIILFSLFLFFLLVKAVALIILLIQALSYFGGSAAEALSVLTIVMLLADFIANLVLWGINKGIRLIGRAASYALLLSPVLLLAVMYLSVEVVLYETGSREAVNIEIISWIITAVYMLIPGTLLAIDLLKPGRVRERLIGNEKARELTLSEKIRKAKK